MFHPFINFCRDIQIKSVTKQMKGQSFPDGVDVFGDINYLNDQKETHTLDVYYPSGVNKLLPIVVSVHGGAFIGGDKFFNKEYCMRLAKEGFCVVNINYDLAPDVDLLGMSRCVNDALLWVHKNIQTYHGDLRFIYGLGDSAGGWQVITYTLVNQSEKLRIIFKYPFQNPIKFKGMILVCPVANIKKAMDKNSRIGSFKHAVYKSGTNGSDYNLTSIQDIIDEGKLPPSIIITTKNDHYHYQSKELHEFMNQRNIEHVYLGVEDKENKIDHCFNIMHPQYIESVETNKQIVEFINANR